MQHLWHNSTSNKLHSIYPTLPINSNYPKAHLTRQRQEQTLYNRLRIGHTYLAHSYLLKDEDPPICNSLLTVEHTHQLYSVASEPGGPGPLTFWRGGPDVVCAPPPVFDRFKFYILTERVTNSQMISKERVKDSLPVHSSLGVAYAG